MRLNFKNTALFDSYNKVWRSVESILIENSCFNQIRLSNSIRSYSKYILPGLIDSHIHIAEEYDFNKLDNFSLEENIDKTMNRVVENSLVALKSGITSIVDFGFFRDSSLSIKDRINSNKDNDLLLPNFFTSGAMLTKKNGHAPERGINVKNIETILNHLINSNVDTIKILNDPIVFTHEEVKLITTIAHKKNLKVSMHLYTDEAAVLALDSGIDCIQHAGNFSNSTLKRIKSSGTIVVPTFIAALDTLINPTLTLPMDHFSDITLDICKDWYHSECNIIEKLHSNEIKIACGTDACFPGTPPDSLIREMLAWNYFNIPILDILQGATYNSALTIGKQNLVGQIIPGAYADFLIYDKNPEDDINILKHPIEVWLRGRKIY